MGHDIPRFICSSIECRPSTFRYRCVCTTSERASERSGSRIVPSCNFKSNIVPKSATVLHSQSHGSLGSQSTWKSKSRPARRTSSRSVTDQTNRRHATQKQLISLFIIPKQPHKKRRRKAAGAAMTRVEKKLER